MAKWLEGVSADKDVVVSSRVRIARNVEGYEFPLNMTVKESDELTENILNAMKDVTDYGFRFLRVSDLTNREGLVYVEEHLISHNMMQKREKSSFLLRDDDKATIMINEEDHIRIQSLYPGLNLKEAWELCSVIDDQLEKKIDYSYDDRLGYLTSCPTNVGTGLRASVMVHLPCLSLTGQLRTIMDALQKVGLTVRGLYGEGSEALGNLYQISNQVTLGESEADIIDKLESVIHQIVLRERNTREDLKNKNLLELEDKIFRSYGILSYNKLISSREAMNHLSNVKLGYEMGLLKNPKLKDLVKLMMNIQPASLQRIMKKEMNREERDINRSKLIREFILYEEDR